MTKTRAGVALLALAVCAGTLGVKRAGAQQADVALVYRLLQGGQMTVTRGGAGHPAQVGERLKNADRVATSADTRAALRFTDDGSILRLNPNSRVVLTSGDERNVVVRTIQLEAGELWTRVNRHQGTTLRVSTSAGVAAVKGTEFVVRVDESSGATTVITLEGVVEFFNGAGRVDVPAGSKVVAADSTAAPRAQPATPQDLQQAQGARGDEGGSTQGTWIEVQLRDANGQTRTLMLQVPADAVRERLEGRP
ncbi:MAG TPA: FecR family protein [Longimicrobium sp.]|nr:FecR family protein [Longimicrobium sp.]